MALVTAFKSRTAAQGLPLVQRPQPALQLQGWGSDLCLETARLQLHQITAVALCVCVFFLFRCPFFFFSLMRVKERTRRNGSHLSEDNGPKAIDVMAPSSE